MGEAVHNVAPFGEGKTNARSPAGVQSVHGGNGLSPPAPPLPPPGGVSREPQLAANSGKRTNAKRIRDMVEDLRSKEYRDFAGSEMSNRIAVSRRGVRK
jgi:hypothetical protein